MNAPSATRLSPVTSLVAEDNRGLLLMVGPSEETAKRIESYLRNAGHPMRCGWVDDLGEVEDILRRSPPDLVLCDESVDASTSTTVLKLVSELRPDLPVLIVGHDINPEAAVSALERGAQDLVSVEPEHLRHLELVVIREFINHHHLRTLRITRDRLSDFEQRHSQLLENTADAVARVQEGILSHVNPAFARLLGRDDPGELIGEPMIDFVAADQRTRVKERLRLVLKGKHDGESLEFNFEGKDKPVPINAQLVLGVENGERMIQMIIRADAVVAAVAAKPTLDPEMTLVQTVSGSLKAPAKPAAATSGGRIGFLNGIAQTISRRQPSGAILLVINGFAALEERIGLGASEEVMEQVALAMKERLLPGDQVFHFSAGELGATVGRTRLSDVQTLGEQLQRELSAQIYATASNESQLTLSVVVYPLGGDEKADAVVQEIVKEARRLSAKGGNQFAMLGAAAEASQTEREDARKAGMVKKAIEENRLKLAYQSIASLEGDSRQHFDVLVRLIDDGGKELHAGEFLPAATKFGLMRSVDRWVVARSLSIIAKRAGTKDAPSLFVRLSEDTLKESDEFLKWLQSLLQAHPPKNEEMVFEIQEVIFQNHIRKAKLLTENLVKLGAGVAIDHFGTSATSSQLLEHLPNVNYLKFHSSFTQKFNEKDINRRMSQLMEVAKQKKVKTIVSHVEDANVMARLWQMGVNYIQGYHVQEPEVVLLASEFITKAKSIHAPR